MSTALDLNQQESREFFWSSGVIAPWFLRPSQIDVYELLLKEKFPFVEAARRFGKTNTILAFVIEQLLKNSGWICRWCFPDKNTAREVLGTEITKIHKNAPDHSKPKYSTVDSFYYFKNDSKLYVRGVNHDRGDSARGPASNIIVADEYGFWREPDYIVREALFPQLENQEGQWLIKCSTPPRELGHRYYIEREDAIRKGRFIQKTIYDNESLSQKEIDIIIEESGGVDSPAFQRERLCKPVADPESLVIPEWGRNEEELTIRGAYERPGYFDCYVGGDSGVDDNTFYLFGFFDFENDCLIVEDEFFCSNETTEYIVDRAKAKEFDLWRGKDIYRRVLDGDKQLLKDITTTHKYLVTLPKKKDKIASINSLRLRIQKKQIKVHEKCKMLRHQLRVGLWKDDKHSDFERTEGLGHLDGIAALMYLNRSLNVKRNPFPLVGEARPSTHFIPNELKKNSSAQSEFKDIAAAFKIKR